MCQSAWSMTKPATVGPMAGAKAMTRPKMPMAEPRRSTGNTSMSTVMVTGIRMPAPAACTRRPPRSTGKLRPTAASSVPTANRLIENTNSFRVENRSCRNAVMGIIMAFTSVNPVVSHWAVDWSTLISTMMDGSAGVTSV